MTTQPTIASKASGIAGSAGIAGIAGIALLAATLVATTTGCSPGVPDNPTWTEDVRPILMANCARCHTVPSIGGAPGYLRLDTYDDQPLDDGSGFRGGAGSFAPIIVLLAAGDEPSMPPLITPLTPRQQDILTLWAEQGAPHGEPLPGNTAPEMTLEPGVVDNAAMTVSFDYEIRDPDGEFVVGMLMAEGLATNETITYQLHSGPGQAVWDISAVLPGGYQLMAELDDGNERFTIDLGSFQVPALAPPSSGE